MSFSKPQKRKSDGIRGADGKFIKMAPGAVASPSKAVASPSKAVASPSKAVASPSKPVASHSKVADYVIPDDNDDSDTEYINRELRKALDEISADEIEAIHAAKPPPMNRAVIKPVPNGPLDDLPNPVKKHTKPPTQKICAPMTLPTRDLEERIMSMIRKHSDHYLQIQQFRQVYNCMYGEKIQCGDLNVTRWLMQFRGLYIDGDKVYIAAHGSREPDHRAPIMPNYPPMAHPYPPMAYQYPPMAYQYHPIVHPYRPIMQTPKVKTSMCHRIINGQYCKYGHMCSFAHSGHELHTYT